MNWIFSNIENASRKKEKFQKAKMDSVQRMSTMNNRLRAILDELAMERASLAMERASLTIENEILRKTVEEYEKALDEAMTYIYELEERSAQQSHNP